MGLVNWMMGWIFGWDDWHEVSGCAHFRYIVFILLSDMEMLLTN